MWPLTVIVTFLYSLGQVILVEIWVAHMMLINLFVRNLRGQDLYSQYASVMLMELFDLGDTQEKLFDLLFRNEKI